MLKVRVACSIAGSDAAMAASRRSQTVTRTHLTTADVVQAAGSIAERGVSEITMAAVAARLGVTPMALYQHVRSKSHLLMLLMNSLLEEIEVPPRSVGRWDVRLRLFHRAVVGAMTRYPGLVGSFEVETHDAPEVPRLLEGYLQILLDGGFDPQTAGLAYTGLYYLAMGVQQPHHGAISPVILPPADHSLTATATVHASATGIGPAEWHEFALDVYLDGLRRSRGQRRTS